MDYIKKKIPLETCFMLTKVRLNAILKKHDRKLCEFIEFNEE